MIDDIIRYENGEMEDSEIIAFFSELVETGMCWSLQGHYGRMAKNLIEGGYLDNYGNILREVEI